MKRPTDSAISGISAVLVLALTPYVAHAETAKTVNGVDIDSSVVDIYIETRTQQPPSQVSGEERTALIDELTDIYLITTQERADELAQGERIKAQAELQYRGLLAQAVAADFLERNQATDEEIFDEYTAQLELQPSKQYKARHILLETQSDAVAVVAELTEGADFEELAKSRSTGPTGPTGGDLGWFSPEQMVKPFSDAVIELENGKFSDEPIQTQFGWHVILREDERDNEPPTLESVRDAIKQRVEQQKLQLYIEGLRSAGESED
ncbi:MAG: peptidylprolyl isomerase [Pseudomonadota bacterium]